MLDRLEKALDRFRNLDAASWARLDRAVWAMAAATILVAVVGLTVFAILLRPEVSPYLMAPRSMPTSLALVGVVGFAMVSPV